MLNKLVTVLTILLSPTVFAADNLPSPGNLPGPHAFLGIHGPADDAAIVDKIILEVFADYTRDNFGGDTYALRYGIEAPFGDSASIRLENLYETWSLPSGAAQGLGVPENGSNIGELAVSSKFLLIRESGRKPATALKLAVKSPAGADENARNTDTIGLLLSVLGAKSIYDNPQSFLANFRLVTELGFAVWDDSDQAQNDAMKWGIATVSYLGRQHRVRIGAYGLVGRRNNGDRPSVAHVEWDYGINDNTSAFVGVEVGLNADADDYSLEAGMRFRFQSIFPWSSPDRS